MLGRILFVIVAVTAFVADRFSKMLIVDRLGVGERIELLGETLQLLYVRNRGIAFGLFSDAGSLVVVGTVVVGVLLFVFMLRVEPEDLVTVLGGALITGGAIGNLWDRVSHGYVIDFIHTPRFPTFNIADICITVGVVLVLLSQLVQMRRELREAKEPEA